MHDDWLDTALEVAEEAAAAAGQLIMRGFRSRAGVYRKGSFDLVTESDRASEKLIRKRIQAAFPTHRIVGEEGEATGDGELVWYVDPIDGTVNYAHGHPYFCVSIALYREAVGLIGVISAPALGTTWKAARGSGALRDGSRCSVSKRASLDEALCTTGFPRNVAQTRDTNEAELGAFLRCTRGVRRCGSTALDLAMVAEGTFDVHWGRAVQAWDIAAGAVIVSEAGGTLSHYDGSHADPTSGELLATNGLLHEPARDIIQRTRQEALS